MKSKSIIILMCILVATILTTAFYFDGRFDIKNDEVSSKKLPGQSQEEYEDMKIKATNMLAAYNELVVFFRINIPDPLDYGFDLDEGWTDQTKKLEWCKIIKNHKVELDRLLSNLDNNLLLVIPIEHKTPKLEELIENDYIPVSTAADEHSVLAAKMIKDFSC